MGSITLALHSTHLLMLSRDWHDDSGYSWCLMHVQVTAAFAVIWQRILGHGPLERLVASCARGTSRLLAGQGGNADPGKCRNS